MSESYRVTLMHLGKMDWSAFIHGPALVVNGMTKGMVKEAAFTQIAEAMGDHHPRIIWIEESK